MKLFFAISGYFVALTMARKSVRWVFKDRAIRIGVPLVVFLVFVNPVTVYLIQLHYGLADNWYDFVAGYPADAASPHTNWLLHLWFLMTLMVFVLMTPILLWLSRHVRSVKMLSSARQGHHGFAVWMGWAVALSVFFVAGRVVHFALFQDLLQGGATNYVVQSILTYLPWYAFGLSLYYKAELLMMMRQLRFLWIACAFSVYATCHLVSLELLENVGRILADPVEIFGAGVAGFAIISLILSLLVRHASKPNRVVRQLSNSAYTVYLIHFPLLIGTQMWLMSKGWSEAMIFFVSVPLVYVAAVIFHVQIVTKYPLAALVFNGKPLPMVSSAVNRSDVG